MFVEEATLASNLDAFKVQDNKAVQAAKEFLRDTNEGMVSVRMSFVSIVSKLSRTVENGNRAVTNKNSQEIARLTGELEGNKLQLAGYNSAIKPATKTQQAWDNEQKQKKQKVNSEINKKEAEIRKLQADFNNNLRDPVGLQQTLDAGKVFIKQFWSNEKQRVQDYHGTPVPIQIQRIVVKLLSEAFTQFRVSIADTSTPVLAVVENLISDLESKKVDTTVYRRARENISDFFTETEVLIRHIMLDIIKDTKSSKPVTDDKMKNIGILYGLKVFRIVTGLAALFVTKKTFMDMFQKSQLKLQLLGLQWFVFIYVMYHTAIDLVTLAVLWVFHRVDPSVISTGVIMDWVFDTVIVTFLVLATTIWICDIMQDKKYFDYQNEPIFAANIMRDITKWVLVLQGMAPWFFTAGPQFHRRSG